MKLFSCYTNRLELGDRLRLYFYFPVIDRVPKTTAQLLSALTRSFLMTVIYFYCNIRFNGSISPSPEAVIREAEHKTKLALIDARRSMG